MILLTAVNSALPAKKGRMRADSAAANSPAPNTSGMTCRRAKRPKPSCKSPASRPSATLRRQSDRSVPLPAARNCSHLKARDLRMMLLRGPRKAAQCGILAERFPGGIKASTICGGKETKALMRAPCKVQGVANFALRRHGAGNNMHIGK